MKFASKFLSEGRVITFVLLLAAIADPTTAVGDQESKPQKEKVICKSETFVGSHVSKRICKTESEWRIGKENAKNTLDSVGRGGDYRTPIGPNK